jgi:hypothetical protein
MITEGTPPTLWPLCMEDEIRIKLAFENLEKENRKLKDIVVRLSETVLRNVVDANTLSKSPSAAEYLR